MTDRTIWKYTLALSDEPSEVEIPISATLVHIDEQAGLPRMWFIVNPHETRTRTRTFMIVSTGHVWNVYARHLGSYVSKISPFVWHVLEIIKEAD